jgi:hypothetical protein
MFSFMKRKPSLAQPTNTVMPKVDVSTRPTVSLGMEVREKVTGFTGIVVVLMHNIDGSISAGVQPRHTTDGRPAEPFDFDLERLEIINGDAGASNTGDVSSRIGIVLGEKYKDKVSGFVGIATEQLEWLGGCSHVVLTPPVGKTGAIVATQRIQVERLELVVSKETSEEVTKVTPTRTGGPSSSDRAMLARRGLL